MLSEKGTYALILQTDANKNIRIGRLGVMALTPGYYVYVGSAFGPGGLKARLSHHLKRAERPHWHIDYLRRFTRVIEVWYSADAVRRERDWVIRMQDLPRMEIAHAGFGASDSKDASHLFRSVRKPDIERFRALIHSIPNHAPVCRSQP